ncbi:MAG TPA: octaprenyl diphosphate synthase [Syntrophus sp. (in: bacteria)]|jgi:octaprenyl-diphosphate synthase|nr:octaprenyl diphosphate synthase [Syntrophus sp. (in: bacteria)]
MMNIQSVFDRYQEDLRKVEGYMAAALRSDVSLIPQVSQHLIGGGGKRFRPLLLMASASLCGYEGERRHPLAAVVEFIHTATLLHDDVIDNADMRRGRPAANHVWGNAASVLVGDFLYSEAFQLMAKYGNLEIIKVLARATNLMAEGEVFQLVKRGDPEISEKDYLSIIERKTSHLISAACAVGALLADAPEEKVAALGRFGLNLGFAFQIVDDALDYTAKEEEFGKVIGKDLDEGKMTLPLIRTLSRCSEEERQQIRAVITDPNRNETSLLAVFEIIRRDDGIDYAVNMARAYIDAGKSELAIFSDQAPLHDLLTLADYVTGRRT